MSTPLELAAFIGVVRRRRVWYDVAAACIAAGMCTTVVALAALVMVLSGAAVLMVAIAAAAVAAAVVLARRAPYWRDRALIDLIETDQPSCRNLLVTAYELTHALTREPMLAPVKPYIRARVMSDAARVAQAVDLDALLPWRSVGNTLGAAALTLTVAAMLLLFVARRSLPAAHEASQAPAGAAASTRTAGAASPVAPAIRHVTIDVIPPSYTGLQTARARDPERLDVLAGSRLRVRIDATADNVGLELDGLPAQHATRASGNAADRVGAFVREVTPVQSGVLAIAARAQGFAEASANAAYAPSAADPNAAAAAHRLIALTLTPDQPPVVTITLPGHDLMASNANGRVRFLANATDDYGLRTLTMHYTKVSGSGERFEFREMELPLTIARDNARRWQGSAERSLHDLGVDVGDMIVYYAAATDNRPGQARAVSDSYVIEISQTGAAIAGGFAVPKDEDVFAISLNALIQKTEKLHGRRATMAARAFAEASVGLAIEQRMVRSQFLFSMGTHGRVEDEEEEAESSNEIQEGRLQNKGQSELTQAVDLMTLAERHLTNAETGDALTAQRAALAAVQRAQSRQRYFLRTIPTASRIDQTRRLTGSLADAASSQHPAPAGSPDTRAATLRTLLADCARLTAMLGSAEPPKAQTPSRALSSMSDLASSIGARMMALDPTSTPLHATAASLLQVAPLAARGRVDDARGLVRAAAALIVPLAQDASAPTPTPVAAAAAGGSAADPALRGAVVDALRHSAQPPQDDRARAGNERPPARTGGRP